MTEPDSVQQLLRGAPWSRSVRRMPRVRYKVPALFGVEPAALEALADRLLAHGFSDTQAELSQAFDIYPDKLRKVLDDTSFNIMLNDKLDLCLNRDGKAAAIHLLVNITRDTKAALQHRIRAAELILSRTTPPAQALPPDDPGRELQELSTDELRSLIDGMQQQLLERAEPVDAPNSAPKQIDLVPDKAKSVFD